MTNDLDAAQTLFGATSPDAGDQIKPSSVAMSQADRLFGAGPAETKSAPKPTDNSSSDKATATTMEAEADKDDGKPASDGDGSDPLEGIEVADHVSDELAGEFREIATELGLDAAGVEKLAAIDLKNRTEFWDNQQTTWLAELQRESDFGGMSSRARSMVKKYGDPGLGDSLGPYGNHPGLVRMLDRIARKMGVA